MPYGVSSRRIGFYPDERTLTGNITLDAMSSSVLCFGSTAARTITLPVIGSVLGRMFMCFNKSTATHTYVTSTGGTVRALAAGKAIQIYAIGSTWRVFRGSTAA